MTIHTIEQPAEKRYHQWRSHEIRQLHELRAQGLSIAAIADRLGRTYEGVRAQMAKLDLVRKRQRSTFPPEVEQIIASGWESLVSAVMQATGRDRRAVVELLRKRAR